MLITPGNIIIHLRFLEVYETAMNGLVPFLLEDNYINNTKTITK